MQTNTLNLAEIVHAANILFTPGSVVEVRIPKAGASKTVSGYFDNYDLMSKQVSNWHGKCPGIYVTLNPVAPALLSRAANRLKPYAEATTGDNDILTRRWLLIDIDAQRQSGISSTDEEHNTALKLAKYVMGDLALEGWPEPIEADSGNGAHLLYRIDLPCADEGLTQNVLKGLAARYNRDNMMIDTSVYNPARICKLYGTMASKGDSTPERPHRMSAITHVPDIISTVPIDLLRGMVIPESIPEPTHAPTNNTFDLETWMARYFPDAKGPFAWATSTGEGKRWRLKECPWRPEDGNSVCVVMLPNGAIKASCKHNTCPGSDSTGNHWQDLRKMRDAEYASRDMTRTAVKKAQVKASESSDEDETNEPDIHYTDSGNALVMTSIYSERIRYDYRRQRWLIWGEHYWHDDYDGEIARYALYSIRHRHKLAVDIDDKAEKKKAISWAMISENSNRLKAMLECVKGMRPIAIRGDTLDTNSFILGCNNGVIDLSNAELRPGLPDDLVTMSINADYDEDAECPKWLKFLHEVFENDEELIAFIQRAVGYSLCGDMREQCLFLCHGSGCNGKSTFLNVIRSIVGDYGINTAFSTFELENRASIPNDVAALMNRRLVTASETSEARRLNEARVKAVTGGDPISCRFMRGEWFSYQPTFKVWLAMNHKPSIQGTDNGIWRRVRLIPFNVNFEATKDDSLEAKLLAEAPGILAWAVQGCLQWFAGGLSAPKAVTQATDKYRVESDVIGQFLLEKTQHIDGAEVGGAVLYRVYSNWCTANGEKAESGNLFSMRLAERNIVKKHKRNGSMYQDMALADDDNVTVQDSMPIIEEKF